MFRSTALPGLSCGPVQLVVKVLQQPETLAALKELVLKLLHDPLMLEATTTFFVDLMGRPELEVCWVASYPVKKKRNCHQNHSNSINNICLATFALFFLIQSLKSWISPLACQSVSET